MIELDDDTDKIPALEEWAEARVEDGRVQLSLGDELTPTGGEEYGVTLRPEAAIALGVKLIEKGYTAAGEEVRRLMVILNPEFEKAEEDEEKPGDLPS